MNNISMVSIGANCFYQALSMILKNVDMLEQILDYSEPRFIYNRKKLTEFRRNDSKNLLAKDNQLIFDHDPVSTYYNDYILLCNKNYKDSYISDYEHIYMKGSKVIDFNNIDDVFLNDKVQVAVSIDTYYLLDDYINNRSYYERWHNYHFVVLDHIKGNKCYIIDSYFNYQGYVEREKLQKAYELIEPSRGIPYIWALNYRNIENMQGINYLLKHCRRYLDKTIVINESRYSTNVEGIQLFKQDCDQIIKLLYSEFGMYAPQYLSFALMGFYLQKRGLSQLFNQLKFDNKYKNQVSLSTLYYKSECYWSKFMRILERSFLKRQPLIDSISNLYNTLYQIECIESNIEEEIFEIKHLLDKGVNILINDEIKKVT